MSSNTFRLLLLTVSFVDNNVFSVNVAQNLACMQRYARVGGERGRAGDTYREGTSRGKVETARGIAGTGGTGSYRKHRSVSMRPA